MDRDEIKGKANESGGRIERQTGEWTGDTKTQARGAAKEVKGKLQKVVGKIKNAAKPKKKAA